MAVLIATGVGLLNYWIIAVAGQMRWGVRGGLLAFLGGLLAYSYLAIGLPGSEVLLKTASLWGVILVALLGAGVGGGSVWIWRQLGKVRKT